MLARSDGEDRSEIAFFDVETTVPSRPGQGHAILEFGAILVCPKKLVELRHYSTLVRPVDLSHISTLSVRCSGITRDAVLSAQSFSEIADVVYDILHGRIWAGHNILRFDCARIREAFAEIKKPAPEPKGTIDSLALLTQKFGRRAGDMKMASLATYFGLGRQTHRSLDDVRMNLEILKYCATVLFLESSLPDIFTEKSWISPNATTRSRSNGKKPTDQIEPSKLRPTSSVNAEDVPTSSPSHHSTSENHPILSLMTPNVGPFDMTSLGSEIERDFRPNNKTEDENTSSSLEEPPRSVNFKGHNGSTNNFLEPHDILIHSISTTLVPFYRGAQKMQILHQNIPLLLQCGHLKVRFGISRKFVDHAGRPRLSIVVNASRDLCNILDAIDELAQKRSIDSGSLSEWRPIVIRNPGYYNFPTIRLHLPTVSDGEALRVLTEIYHKDDTSTLQRLVFSGFDAVELDSLFTTGNFVDAFFSFDAYDYQQSAGIRLVAKKLVVYS